MQKKIIAICICGLILAGTISSASIVRNKRKIVNNSKEDTKILDSTTLTPPWDSNGYGNVQDNLDATGEYDLDYNNYQGSHYAKIWGVKIGWVQVDVNFYHIAKYTTPCSGEYDFNLKYEYNVDLDLDFATVAGCEEKFIQTNIYIYTYLTILDEETEQFKDYYILDNKKRTDNFEKSYSDTKSIRFIDIYIPKDTKVLIGVTAWTTLYGKVDCTEGGLEDFVGECNWNKGKLKEIKITEPNTNDPPNRPDRPYGTKTGKKGNTYTYSTSTTDPDGDPVYFKWSWGDGTYSSWTDSSASHSWSEKGDYIVKVKAKDSHGAETQWSEGLSISMPKDKAKIIPLFQWFLLKYPFLFRIIEQIQ